MKNLLHIIIFGTALAACSPKITSNMTGTYNPLPDDAEVAVIEYGASAPDNAELLGTIKIGDSGFTMKDGSYNAVISLAKEKARQAGGNVVQITKHKAPDMVSSIHRIEANILRVADVSSLVLSPDNTVNTSHPDYAIIYFYRTSGVGPLVNYEVYIGEEPVYRAKVKSKAEVKIYEAGDMTIWAKHESKTTRPLKVELGGEYYLRCSVTMGAFVGRPALEKIPASSGKTEYETIQIKE